MTAESKALSGGMWFAEAEALGRSVHQSEVTLSMPDLGVLATITGGIEPDALARVMSAHMSAVAASVAGLGAHAGGRVSIIFTAPGTHAHVAPAGVTVDPAPADWPGRDRGQRYEILGVIVRDQLGTPAAAADRGTATKRFLRRRGDYWTIVDGAVALHFKDSKGLRCLARLLSEPNTEVHVLELVAGIADGEGPGARAARGSCQPAALRSADTGPMLDHKAKAAYRARLRDLDQVIDEATEFGDAGRAARAEAEKDALLHQLASALGLGGRDRKMASVSERARINATRTIHSAIDKIAHSAPALGRHLRASIHTGTFCCYRPPADGSAASWVVE